MHLIPLSSIIVGDRQRKSLRNIPELAESIRRNGLIHAPVVEPEQDWLPGKCSKCNGTGETDDQSEGRRACNGCGGTGDNFGPTGKYRLIAGERRLRAIESINFLPKDELDKPVTQSHEFIYAGEVIPMGFIPVTFRSELTDVQRREIELEENLLRENLTWQEEAVAIADLHELRERERGAQTITATTKEIAEKTGESFSNVGAKVSRAITVAKQLSDPKVAGARNLKEAANIVNRSFEAQIQQDLIKAVGETTEHVLINESSLLALPELPSNYFDCILTDPPYGMGADSFGDVGPQHGYIDTLANAIPIWEEILREGLRVCRPNAHLYMFCDIERFVLLRETAFDLGWKPFRTPIIWNKTSSMGHDPWPLKGFRRSYECILYAMKGDRPYISMLEDVIDAPNISSPLHPAAKPAALFEKLLRRSCNAGDRVLDPCCGIGTIFEAASACRVTATGIELDPDYATIASNRRFQGR